MAYGFSTPLHGFVRGYLEILLLAKTCERHIHSQKKYIYSYNPRYLLALYSTQRLDKP